jgi:hypothetical protein
VDTQALIAREQTATEAVSQAMLAVTNLRQPVSRQRMEPSGRPCFFDRVQRAAQEQCSGGTGMRALVVAVGSRGEGTAACVA